MSAAGSKEAAARALEEAAAEALAASAALDASDASDEELGGGGGGGGGGASGLGGHGGGEGEAGTGADPQAGALAAAAAAAAGPPSGGGAAGVKRSRVRRRWDSLAYEPGEIKVSYDEVAAQLRVEARTGKLIRRALKARAARPRSHHGPVARQKFTTQ